MAMHTDDPVDAFRAYAATCDTIQKRIIAIDNKPEQTKTLRGFTLKEVCRVLDCQEQDLQELGADLPLLRPGGRASLTMIADLRNALHARHPNRSAATPLTRTCTITVTNFKGGAAKTMTAVHLAQHLTLRGFRVLLIDLDSQASATTAFGFAPNLSFAPEQTLWTLFRGDCDSVEPLITSTHWAGLDLVPANLGLYRAEFELPARQVRERGFRFWPLLRDAIAKVEGRYDVVLCDCPPSLGYLAINAFFAATGMIVPCPPSMFDFASTGMFFSQLADTLDAISEAARERTKAPDFMRLLITKLAPSDRNQQILTGLLERSFPGQMLNNRMVQTTALDMAGSFKRTLYEVEPGAKSLERALEHLDAVNREIENLIVANDTRYRDNKKEARAA
jgi:chromosome partitioning protein